MVISFRVNLPVICDVKGKGMHNLNTTLQEKKSNSMKSFELKINVIIFAKN